LEDAYEETHAELEDTVNKLTEAEEKIKELEE